MVGAQVLRSQLEPPLEAIFTSKPLVKWSALHSAEDGHITNTTCVICSTQLVPGSDKLVSLLYMRRSCRLYLGRQEEAAACACAIHTGLKHLRRLKAPVRFRQAILGLENEETSVCARTMHTYTHACMHKRMTP